MKEQLLGVKNISFFYYKVQIIELIIPEFVQREFDEKKIFYKSCRILEGKSEKIKMKKGYSFLKKELGEEGVVQRAAKDIINSIT